LLIDFEELKAEGLLQEIPDSAATDNAPSGSSETYTGRYIWYVDNNGVVKSMYVELPSSSGFQIGVFP
jgi:hypothetical protein